MHYRHMHLSILAIQHDSGHLCKLSCTTCSIIITVGLVMLRMHDVTLPECCGIIHVA